MRNRTVQIKSDKTLFASTIKQYQPTENIGWARPDSTSEKVKSTTSIGTLQDKRALMSDHAVPILIKGGGG